MRLAEAKVSSSGKQWLIRLGRHFRGIEVFLKYFTSYFILIWLHKFEKISSYFYGYTIEKCRSNEHTSYYVLNRLHIFFEIETYSELGTSYFSIPTNKFWVHNILMYAVLTLLLWTLGISFSCTGKVNIYECHFHFTTNL